MRIDSRIRGGNTKRKREGILGQFEEKCCPVGRQTVSCAFVPEFGFCVRFVCVYVVCMSACVRLRVRTPGVKALGIKGCVSVCVGQAKPVSQSGSCSWLTFGSVSSSKCV